MLGQQPKRREENGVKPDYYFGDIKNQRKYLIAYVNAVNANKQPWEPMVDPGDVVRRCMKRISRFYGYQNKYDGQGNLREDMLD